MQVIVSTSHSPLDIPKDVDNLSAGGQTVYVPRLNEVLSRVPDGVTAVVDGDDIVKGDVRSLGLAKNAKIVEVDSLPDNYVNNGFTYDGTTWAVNEYYDLLKRVPKHVSDSLR